MKGMISYRHGLSGRLSSLSLGHMVQEDWSVAKGQALISFGLRILVPELILIEEV